MSTLRAAPPPSGARREPKPSGGLRTQERGEAEPGRVRSGPAPAFRSLALLLAAALVAALVGFGWALHRARVLAARVDGLEASLASAHAELAARRRHLGAIRAGIASLRERVDALEALAARDPTSKPSPDDAPRR